MSQSFSQIYLHIVFSTKLRRPCFQDEDFSKKLHSYLAGICQNQKCFAKIVGGHIDHVHALCSMSRQKTIADLVHELKLGSSSWIKTQHPEFSDFHWQDGYGAFSVSYSQLDKVKAYIGSQSEHHKTKSFMDEFRKMLKLHGIEFEEKHIWD